VADLVDAAFHCILPHPRFAYIAPYYIQAKDVAWMYLKDYAIPLGATANESELHVDFPHNGARVRLYGADNPDRLRGPYLDGLVLDEYADMAPSVWGDVLRPMLADRRGWATVIGTPKGRNAFFEIYDRASREPEWLALMFRASETGILPIDELESARRDMTPEQYAQEFECSFEAAIMGAYFGKEMAEAERQGRIKHVPIDPLLPTHTAWDIGVSEHMAIWAFQVSAGEIRVVDYISRYNFSMETYCAELNDKLYHGTDWVPHDAKVRSTETGRTRIETLTKLGRKPRLVPDHKVHDGIQAARLTFPRCYFDADNCREGLEALRQYRADYDEKTRAFKDSPKKDWATHPADAFRYLAMAWREIKPPPPPPKPGRDIHHMTLDEAYKYLKPHRPGIRI
jgi:hypothetical protein